RRGARGRHAFEGRGIKKTGRRAAWPVPSGLRRPASQLETMRGLATMPSGANMLELRPTCEHCNKALPPDSLEARICSYECTFCATCADDLLGNVCPNCGGGFAPRPVRPAPNC